MYAERRLGSLTRFPSGFCDNEVVKTVVLQQTDRQKKGYVNKEESWQLSYLRIKRDESERITTEWSGEASGTHMWDYQVLLDVHQLLHTRRPARRENKV